MLPFVPRLKKEYYLVGGTAIALQIGHRESIDFIVCRISLVVSLCTSAQQAW